MIHDPDLTLVVLIIFEAKGVDIKAKVGKQDWRDLDWQSSSLLAIVLRFRCRNFVETTAKSPFKHFCVQQ